MGRSTKYWELRAQQEMPRGLTSHLARGGAMGDSPFHQEQPPHSP